MTPQPDINTYDPNLVFTKDEQKEANKLRKDFSGVLVPVRDVINDFHNAVITPVVEFFTVTILDWAIARTERRYLNYLKTTAAKNKAAMKSTK